MPDMGTVTNMVVDSQWPRLDRYLAANLADISRTRIQQLIRSGNVSVDGQTLLKVKAELLGGESISIDIPDQRPADHLLPQAMDLDILYEDEVLAVINKPAGLVTHPGAGVADGTLANGLAARFAELSPTGGPLRPGIVHRLDKDTSGVMVVAKTEGAHANLARQFEERAVTKKYRAIVWGTPPASGTVDGQIIRDPRNRVAFTVGMGGREATTLYKRLEIFDPMAYLELSPRTGRTHQIRVHLAHIGHPIFGDATYGGVKEPNSVGQAVRGITGQLSATVSRQLLHAHTLTFQHPVTGEKATYVAPEPADFGAALTLLKANHDAD